MLACPFLPVPAGQSVTLSGATYGFTCTLAGVGATWAEQGGSAIPLDATGYLPTSDRQPFGDIVFTADASSPLRIYYAKSVEQLKRLPAPTGGAPTAGTLPTVVVGNNIHVQDILTTVSTKNPGSTNVKNTNGSAGAGETALKGALTGGTGSCLGIIFSNTGSANSLLVYVNAVVVGVCTITNPNFFLEVDPNSASITDVGVSSAAGTTYSATALYL